jgi:hypothetical protein
MAMPIQIADANHFNNFYSVIIKGVHLFQMSKEIPEPYMDS